MTIHVVDLQNFNEFSLEVGILSILKKIHCWAEQVACLKVEKNLKKSEINVLLPIIFFAILYTIPAKKLDR